MTLSVLRFAIAFDQNDSPSSQLRPQPFDRGAELLLLLSRSQISHAFGRPIWVLWPLWMFFMFAQIVAAVPRQTITLRPSAVPGSRARGLRARSDTALARAPLFPRDLSACALRKHLHARLE